MKFVLCNTVDITPNVCNVIKSSAQLHHVVAKIHFVASALNRTVKYANTIAKIRDAH